MSLGTLLTATDHLVHVEHGGYSADLDPSTGVVDVYGVDGTTHTWLCRGSWDGVEATIQGVDEPTRQALSVALRVAIN